LYLDCHGHGDAIKLPGLHHFCVAPVVRRRGRRGRRRRRRRRRSEASKEEI
jgi:hypothetical protein